MKWEYHVEHFIYEEDLEGLLNDLGKDDWELVGIIPVTSADGLEAVQLLFKRGKVRRRKVKTDGK